MRLSSNVLGTSVIYKYKLSEYLKSYEHVKRLKFEY